jgi:phage gpG-like protein
MEYKLTIPKKDLEKLNKGTEFRAGMLKGLKKSMIFAEGESKKSFGRPGHLKSRSGHLRRSIKSKVKETNTGAEGILSNNVIYAAIHEYGGMAGRNLKTRIPARPFLKPAVEDNKIKISRLIKQEIMKEVKRNAR